VKAKVAVAGGGIGGIATVLELLETRGMSGTDIVLIEGPAPAGRLSTVTTPTGQCERGAGRFSLVLHPRLTALTERHAVRTRPFHFRVEYAFAARVEALGGLNLKADPDSPYACFDDYMVAEYGRELTEALASAVGYQALREHRFPAIGGVELVTTHPESFLGSAFAETWVTPTDGFEALVRTLRASVLRHGVRILESDRVTRISEHTDGVDITVRGLRSRERLVQADQLVLAVPPRDVQAIRFDSRVDLAWIADLVTVDLFKGTFFYDEPWWDLYDLQDTVVITDDELRKIYFDSKNSTVFIYTDNYPSVFWHHQTARLDEFASEALGGIRLATGLPLDALKAYTSISTAFWPAGVVYSQTGSSLPTSLAISERVAVVSDALSDWPGWIEGALECAHQVVAHLAI
jgi:tryptophan oxidase VioA